MVVFSTLLHLLKSSVYEKEAQETKLLILPRQFHPCQHLWANCATHRSRPLRHNSAALSFPEDCMTETLEMYSALQSNSNGIVIFHSNRFRSRYSDRHRYQLYSYYRNTWQCHLADTKKEVCFPSICMLKNWMTVTTRSKQDSSGFNGHEHVRDLLMDMNI